MRENGNYLLTIFNEHLENPYNIDRLSMDGGCIEIEERLYSCVEQELGLQTKEDQRVHELTGGRTIYLNPNAKEMYEDIMKKVNGLTDDQVDQMARFQGNISNKRIMQQRFYLSKSHDYTNTYLKFIIMYLYGDIYHAKDEIFGLKTRDEVIKYMKDKITQPLVTEAINFMNKRYSKNVLGQEVDI